METVKRVEILTGVVEFDQVVRVLERCGVTGYAVLPGVLGKGDRASGSADPLTGDAENRMIFTTCREEALPALIEHLRPLLIRYGGACVVTDAQCVVRCHR
jgi:hypothetical protein